MKHYEVRNEKQRPSSHRFAIRFSLRDYTTPPTPPLAGSSSPKGEPDGAGAVDSCGAPEPLVKSSAQAPRRYLYLCNPGCFGGAFSWGLYRAWGKRTGCLQLCQRGDLHPPNPCLGSEGVLHTSCSCYLLGWPCSRFSPVTFAPHPRADAL